MKDILIRDVPSEVIAALDARATRLGLSRTEYLRRRLVEDTSGQAEATTSDLRKFGETFADLADPTIMDAAWR